MEAIIGESIGWIGNVMLALCAIPQAIKCHRNGHSKGLDKTFLWMWYIGEIGACFYHNHTSDRIPQNVNYVVNLIAISIIIYYRYFERKQDEGIKRKDNLITKENEQ